MPPQAAEGAAEIDFTFYYIYWISVIFFALVAGLMFWFMYKYRRRHPNDHPSGPTHHTALEVTWSIVPAFLMIPMFWWGFEGFMHSRTPPQNTYNINVIAQKWNWEFIYPNGYSGDELHVPAGQPVKLVMSSKDVIHSLSIPAFRVKRDVVPGRYAFIWFEALHTSNELVRYPLYCTEYCGTSHSDMRATVVVHPTRESFDDWLANVDPFSPRKMSDEQFAQYKADPAKFIAEHGDPKLLPPVEMGRQLYTKRGCFQCHSLDGKTGTGPTWKGMWGHSVEFTDGTRLDAIDENYIRESILEPNKKIVKGFVAGQMPKFSLNEREIYSLIEFMKSLAGDEKK